MRELRTRSCRGASIEESCRHHKRGKPKSARAGCPLCKPHKHQAEKHRDRSRRKRDERWQVEQWREATGTDRD